MRVTIVVEPSAPGILNNQAKLVREGADPSSSTSADESTTVLSMSDLTISLQDFSTSLIPGDEVTFDLLITNGGPSAATGVLVSETLPDGLLMAPSAADPSNCTVSGGEITCQIGNLANGESRALSVTLAIDPAVIGDLVNNITVSGAESDIDFDNNTVSATLSITQLADLSLNRTDILGPFPNDPEVKDDEIASIFTIINNGPSGATNVVLTNELSVDVTLVSVSGDPAVCRVTGGTVVCEINDLGAGESATFTMVLAPRDGGQMSSKVGVKADQGSSPDFDPWYFFLDPDVLGEEIASSRARFQPVIGRGNGLLIGSVLLGLSLAALVSVLGRSAFAAGKRRRGAWD